MARYLYSELSRTIEARKNCADTMQRYRKESQIPATARPSAVNYFDNASEWFDKHTATIKKLCVDHLPSGSGFNGGTTIDLDASHAEKLVLHTAFHYMDENGYYDGWTEHTVTVTPSLAHTFHLRISGRNRDDIKEMMYQEFDSALRQDVTYWLLVDQFPQFKVEHKWEAEDGTPSQCYQAFYVDGKRFWNDFAGAYECAGKRMEDALHAK